MSALGKRKRILDFSEEEDEKHSNGFDVKNGSAGDRGRRREKKKRFSKRRESIPRFRTQRRSEDEKHTRNDESDRDSSSDYSLPDPESSGGRDSVSSEEGISDDEEGSCLIVDDEESSYASDEDEDVVKATSYSKIKEEIPKVYAEQLKEEEKRRQEELDRCLNMQEVSAWFRDNLWGPKVGTTYSVGGATTSTCTITGKVELLPYKRLAEEGTRVFKMFKEQLVTENYDNWKLAAGKNWRMKMSKANVSMEKNLCKATANYFSAFHGARNRSDLVTARSLARNLLVSYSYLASRVRENCRMVLFSQAMDTFNLCLEMAMEVKDCSWLQPGVGRRGVVDIFIDLVDEWGVLLPTSYDNIREMVREGEKFVGKLNKWTTCNEERKVLGLARVRQGEAMFNKAAMLMGEKNYVDALYLFTEMYTVVEEAKRLVRLPDDGDDSFDQVDVDLDIRQDLRLLITDVRIHTALADALKEIHNADKILKNAVEGYESLQLELVYNAVDKYRLAVTLARGEDLEIMCIAFTKIASVYLTVFKDGIHKTRAKETLNEVMDISKVMGRNLYTMDWYQEASSHVRNLQLETQKKEDELWQNRRKVYMDQLTVEVKLLEEHSSDENREFLVFLFDKFPPKHRAESEWKHLLPAEGDNGNETWRKTMMKLVTIYHPDRVDKTVHGDKYHVLCEEITKELTGRYGKFTC